MKQIFMMLLMACANAVMAAGTVVVKSVEAHQRYPWNGLVDIVVTIEGSADEVSASKCTFVATNVTIHAAVPVVSITRRGSDTGSNTTWTRSFVWDAATDIGSVVINDVALTVVAKVPGVQLWENGPYWAECNVGATKPEEYGYYFWWGDTVGYKLNANHNGWVAVNGGASYSFKAEDCPTYGKDNSQLLSAGYIDLTGNLAAAHDAATAHLGEPWRMPTDAEFSALINNCDTTWTTRNGVCGQLVTGKGAYASSGIFLPAAGYALSSSYFDSIGSGVHCWTSTPYENADDLIYAWSVFGKSGGTFNCFDYYVRRFVMSVRPIRGSAGITDSQAANSVMTHVKLDCRTGRRKCSADGEVLRYDADWYENGERVRITDNGTVVTEGTAGCYTWVPELISSRVHELKLEVLSGDEIVASETAQFEKESLSVKSVEARQRYPWNGLVDIVVTFQGTTDDIAEAEWLFNATNCATGAVVPVTSIVQKGNDTGAGIMWTRRFVWDATSDVGAAKIDDLALVVDAKVLGGVQLWENGPYWAECNVGAAKPEEYGYYFWWGDTVGCKRNSSNDGWISVKDGGGFLFSSGDCPTLDKDNSQLQSAGYIDSTGRLVAAHDAATAHLGAPWRMPTDAELFSLVINCDTQWTTRGGVYGRLVSGRGIYASKSIFLPAAGHGSGSSLYDSGSCGSYWSSASGSDRLGGGAWCLYFNSSDFSRYYDGCSGGGSSVRPLRGFAQTMAAESGVITHFGLDCRTGVRECSSDGEVLRYDSNWYENGSEARITENGAVVTTGTAGVYTWHPTPSCSTRHVLKLEVRSNGQVVGTETAEFESVATLAHSEVITTTPRAPSCIEDGCTKGSKCSRCNAVLATSMVLSALGHVEVVTIPAREPTCTESGCSKGSYCSRCGVVLFTSQVVPAGHSECVTTAAKAATCTAAGCTKGSYCSRCNEILSVSEVIPALGHDPVVVLEAVEPTSAAAGRTARIRCSRCGVTFQESETLPALGYIRNFKARELTPFKVWEFSYDIAEDIADVLPFDQEATVKCESYALASKSDKNGQWKEDVTDSSVRRDIHGNLCKTRFYSLSAECGGFQGVVFHWKCPNDRATWFALTLNGEREVIFDNTYYDEYDWSWLNNNGWCERKVGVMEKLSTINWSYIIDASSEGGYYNFGDFGIDNVKLLSTERVIGDISGMPGRHVLCDDRRDVSGVDLLHTSVEVGLGTVPGVNDQLLRVSVADLQMEIPNDEVLVVTGCQEIAYSVLDADSTAVLIDGKRILVSSTCGSFVWRPCETGMHEIVHIAGTNRWTQLVNVTDAVSPQNPIPQPPTAEDPAIALATNSYVISSSGGAGMIATSGSGTWSAASSVDWITIPSAFSTRTAGLPVVYQVAANVDAMPRKGYVYVSGHVLEVVQSAVDMTLSASSTDFGTEGGRGTIEVNTADGASWIATTTADWICIENVSGEGAGIIKYSVAPWYDKSVRSANIMIGGRAFKINQVGRHVVLAETHLTVNYSASETSVKVDALADARWTVDFEEEWIHVVGARAGVGSGKVVFRVDENLTYDVRSARVKIGDDECVIEQLGRRGAGLSLRCDPGSISVSPLSATNELHIMATPGLSWSVYCSENWFRIISGNTEGIGDGVVRVVIDRNGGDAPRNGTIEIMPADGSRIEPIICKVSQQVAEIKLSLDSCSVSPDGGKISVDVDAPDWVFWGTSSKADWLGVWPGARTLLIGSPACITVAKNPTLYARTGTVVVAGKEISVVQAGWNVRIEKTSFVLSNAQAFDAFTVNVNNGVNWTAVTSDPEWLVIMAGEGCDYDDNGNVTGSGNGEIQFLVAQNDSGKTRTGYITIGSTKIAIVQGDSACEVVLDANGGVCAESNRGVERGSICGVLPIPTRAWYVFAGWYTLPTGGVRVSADSTVDSSVTYFAHWSPLCEGDNRLYSGVFADNSGASSCDTTKFPAVTNLVTRPEMANWSHEDGGENNKTVVYWGEMYFPAGTYRIGGSYDDYLYVKIDEKVIIASAWTSLAFANVTFETAGWHPIELRFHNAGGLQGDSYAGSFSGWTFGKCLAIQDVTSNPQSTDRSPGNFTVFGLDSEGNEIPGIFRLSRNVIINFDANGGACDVAKITLERGDAVGALPMPTRTGYSFVGWFTSSSGGTQVSPETTATDSTTLYAHWTANAYSISYDANGGSGEMSSSPTHYDADTTLSSCAFTRKGYRFCGWATSLSGAVTYTNGQSIKNLTATDGAEVTLYAAWEPAGIRVNYFRQRYPWTGLVDLEIVVTGDAWASYPVVIHAVDGNGKALAVKTIGLAAPTANGNPVTLKTGSNHIVWDAMTDLGEGYKCDSVSMRATLVTDLEQ